MSQTTSSTTNDAQVEILGEEELVLMDFHLRTPVGLAPLSGLPFDHSQAIARIEQVIASHRAQSAALHARDTTIAELVEALKDVQRAIWRAENDHWAVEDVQEIARSALAAVENPQ